MNETVLIVGIFLMSLLIFGTLAAAVATAGPGNKATRRRLARFRQRYGASENAILEQARSIMLSDNEGSGFEAMLSRLMPRKDMLRKRLKQTGRDIPLGRYAAISIVVGLVAAVLSVILMGAGFAPALLTGIAAGVALPHWFVGQMIKRRQRQFLALFPEAIDLMVRSLKSGLPINEAIGIVGQEIGDPVGQEFARIADQIRLGKPLEDALWRTADRLDFPDFKFFVIALGIQRETGGNLAETLDNLANILRSRHQMKLKIKALSSEGKASAMIIGALPFVMFGIIYALNADYMSTFFTDPRAQAALVGALVWMGIGGFIIKKMINFEI